MGEFAVILFIFYTKPKAELIAEEMLVKDGFEVFLPKMNQCSIWKKPAEKNDCKTTYCKLHFRLYSRTTNCKSTREPQNRCGCNMRWKKGGIAAGGYSPPSEHSETPKKYKFYQ